MYLSRSGAFAPEAAAPVAGLKFFNVYGPNEYHKGTQQSVVPQFYNSVKLHSRIGLFRSTAPGIADGMQSRDFVSVDDCASVILWMLEHPQATGLFNVGTSTATSFLSVAREVIDASGIRTRIEFVDMPPQLVPQYQSYTCADISRLRAAGYTGHFTEAPTGIRNYIANYLSKSDIYK